MPSYIKLRNESRVHSKDLNMKFDLGHFCPTLQNLSANVKKNPVFQSVLWYALNIGLKHGTVFSCEELQFRFE